MTMISSEPQIKVLHVRFTMANLYLRDYGKDVFLSGNRINSYKIFLRLTANHFCIKSKMEKYQISG